MTTGTGYDLISDHLTVRFLLELRFLISKILHMQF